MFTSGANKLKSNYNKIEKPHRSKLYFFANDNNKVVMLWHVIAHFPQDVLNLAHYNIIIVIKKHNYTR